MNSPLHNTQHLTDRGQLVNQTALIRFSKSSSRIGSFSSSVDLHYLFVLHVKSLINLEMFSSTFGIGGGTIAPTASPGNTPCLKWYPCFSSHAGSNIQYKKQFFHFKNDSTKHVITDSNWIIWKRSGLKLSSQAKQDHDLNHYVWNKHNPTRVSKRRLQQK